MAQRKKTDATEAVVKYANAQADEALARSSTPENIHEDLSGADAAHKVAAEALKELDNAVRAEKSKEDAVTLVGPNPRVSLTDANGVRFENGEAKDVPKSLAERYMADFDGYSVKGS